MGSQKSQTRLGDFHFHLDFPGGSDGKASVYNAGDLGSIPRWGRSPGEENGTPLQYSCLENPVDGGAWWTAVHRVAKSRTRLTDLTFRASLVAQTVKNLPAMWETQFQSLGREDPLEEGHCSPLQYSCLENPKDGGA